MSNHLLVPFKLDQFGEAHEYWQPPVVSKAGTWHALETVRKVWVTA